jgi:hypothetical protein
MIVTMSGHMKTLQLEPTNRQLLTIVELNVWPRRCCSVSYYRGSGQRDYPSVTVRMIVVAVSIDDVANCQSLYLGTFHNHFR